MTNRWTVNSFIYILDVAAYNSFVLDRLRNPDLYQKDFNRQRRYSLERLAVQLIRLGIKSRIDKCSLNNFWGIRSTITNAIIITGENLVKSNILPNKKLEKRAFCKFSSGIGERSETRNACVVCSSAIRLNKHSYLYILSKF